MQEAPIPSNEKERLDAVMALKILDTSAEERFDRITKMATRIFNVPISTVTIVDSNREWFKSCEGLDNTEGERAISFCGHAMLEDGIFVIPDATKDDRFKDNPMVIGEPYIRFYAGVPLRDYAGNKIGTFCIKDHKPKDLSDDGKQNLKDLAAWVELEMNNSELAKAIQVREQIEKAQDEFVALASHQMRTPINNLLWTWRVLMGEKVGKLNEEQKAIFASSKDYLTDLNEMIASFLMLARVEAGRLPVDLTLECKLKETIQQVIDKHKRTAELKSQNLKFDCEFDGGIKTDPTLLKEVVCNLISNAMKYSPPQSSIKIFAKEIDSNSIQIDVSDNGYGIPKEEQDKIFQKFFRAENIENNREVGTGIGLYFVSKVIRILNGSISFESTENNGTTFSITLPLNNQSNDE